MSRRREAAELARVLALSTQEASTVARLSPHTISWSTATQDSKEMELKAVARTQNRDNTISTNHRSSSNGPIPSSRLSTNPNGRHRSSSSSHRPHFSPTQTSTRAPNIPTSETGQTDRVPERRTPARSRIILSSSPPEPDLIPPAFPKNLQKTPGMGSSDFEVEEQVEDRAMMAPDLPEANQRHLSPDPLDSNILRQAHEQAQDESIVAIDPPLNTSSSRPHQSQQSLAESVGTRKSRRQQELQDKKDADRDARRAKRRAEKEAQTKREEAEKKRKAPEVLLSREERLKARHKDIAGAAEDDLPSRGPGVEPSETSRRKARSVPGGSVLVEESLSTSRAQRVPAIPSEDKSQRKGKEPVRVKRHHQNQEDSETEHQTLKDGETGEPSPNLSEAAVAGAEPPTIDAGKRAPHVVNREVESARAPKVPVRSLIAEELLPVQDERKFPPPLALRPSSVNTPGPSSNISRDSPGPQNPDGSFKKPGGIKWKTTRNDLDSVLSKFPGAKATGMSRRHRIVPLHMKTGPPVKALPPPPPKPVKKKKGDSDEEEEEEEDGRSDEEVSGSDEGRPRKKSKVKGMEWYMVED